MKKQRSTFKKISVVSAILVLGFSGQSAYASDAKAIPGTNCVDETDQTQVSYDSFYGTLFNDVNGFNRVECPVVRDTMAANANHFLQPVRVQLQKTGNTTTTCYLDSRTQAGDSGVFKSGTVVGAGYKTLSISQPIQSFAWGAMNISCGLQSGDKLHGYNYDER